MKTVLRQGRLWGAFLALWAWFLRIGSRVGQVVAATVGAGVRRVFNAKPCTVGVKRQPNIARRMQATLTALLLVCLSATAWIAPAQGQSLPYSQTFDTGTSNNGAVTVLTGWTGTGTIVNYNNNTPPYMLSCGTLSSLNLTVSDFHMKVAYFWNSSGGYFRFRQVDANNYYYLIASTQQGAGYQWHKVVAGVDSQIGSTFNPYYNSAGGFAWLELNAVGSTVSMRAWAIGGTAPAYGNSFTDSTFSSGTLGFGNNAFIDTLSVDSLASTALTAGTTSANSAGATSVLVSDTGATGGTSPYDYTPQYCADASGSPSGSLVNDTGWTNGTAQTSVAGAPTSATIGSLTTGTKYWFRWKEVDHAGTPATVYTTPVFATPTAALTAGSISFTNVANTSLTANTTAPSGGTGAIYNQFQWSTDNGSNAPTGSLTTDTGWTNFGGASTVTSQDLTGLTANTKYWVRTKVQDGGGTGTIARGTPASVTTANVSALSLTSLTVTPNVSAGTVSAAVVWTGGTANYAVRLHRSTAPGFSTSGTTAGSGTCVAVLTGQTGTSATLTDPNPSRSILFYRAEIVDSATQQATVVSTTASATWLQPLGYCLAFAADSIHWANDSNGFTPGYNNVPGYTAIALRKMLGVPVIAATSDGSAITSSGTVQLSRSGSTSSNWASGLPGTPNTYLTSLVAGMNASCPAGYTKIVGVSLTFNDVTTTGIDAAGFAANIKLISEYLAAQGYKVVLFGAKYALVGDAYQTKMLAFNAQLAGVATYEQAQGRQVYLGDDTNPYNFFALYPNELGDGVHLLQTGCSSLGQIEAKGFQKVLVPDITGTTTTLRQRGSRPAYRGGH